MCIAFFSPSVDSPPDQANAGQEVPVTHFIETSTEINEPVKVHVLDIVGRGFYQSGKRPYRAKIAVMGLTYKENIDDPRESPAIKIIEELVNLGADVRVYDPFVPSLATKVGVLTSVGNVEEALTGADCALFLVDNDFVPPNLGRDD